MNEKTFLETELLLKRFTMNSDSKEEQRNSQIVVNRKALTVDDRRSIFLYDEPKSLDVKKKLQHGLKKTFKCNREKFKSFLYSKLPILDWLPNYDVKNWLVGDFVAGLTVAIMHIPQGMGFALLAYVPAITGIYMAFYQSLIYAIFATSRHNSMGTFAVITLMTGKVVKQLATFPESGLGSNQFSQNMTTTEVQNYGFDSTLPPVPDYDLFQSTIGSLIPANEIETSDENVRGLTTEALIPVTELMGLGSTLVSSTPGIMTDGTYTPVQIATIVCFMVGIWHMIFGLLQLGSLAVFLSEMLVSGFTTAAAVHVLASQMKDLLGIDVPGFSGPFKIIFTFIEIFKALPTANIATILVTVVSLSILIFNNEVLKPRMAKISKIPIPIELIAVASGTAISYLVNFSSRYEVKIIGNVPTGLPPPAAPPFNLMGTVAVDSFVIAIVAYTINFSLAKIFAVKHSYEVDATQELYANGISNLFSSFFGCAPMASALARTLVQDSVGGVTQMASLIVCAIILLVLLFIGPLFETLPKAVLASIIVTALKGMFMQFKDMLTTWKVSKIDAITWVVTFLSVVLIDIDYGLLIGIIFSLFVLLARNQLTKVTIIGKVPNTDLYLDANRYPQAKELPGIKMFAIVGSIHFANRENLKSEIVKMANLNKKQSALENQTKETVFIKNMMITENGEPILHLHHKVDENEVRHLILDASGISAIDWSGAKFLQNLKSEYEKMEVQFYIAGLTDSVTDSISKTGFLDKFPPSDLFHSLQDAASIIHKRTVL